MCPCNAAALLQHRTDHVVHSTCDMQDFNTHVGKAPANALPVKSTETEVCDCAAS